MHGYSELYFHEFSLRGARSAVIGFNLCIGCGDTPSSSISLDTETSSPFYVYFQCSRSASPSAAAAPWKLLKSYPHSAASTRYPDQRLALPLECNEAAAVNLVFTARSFAANIHIDSFMVFADGELDVATTPRPALSVVDRLDAMSVGRGDGTSNAVSAASTADESMYSVNEQTVGPLTPDRDESSISELDDDAESDDAVHGVAGTVGSERIEENGMESDSDSALRSDWNLEAEAELSTTGSLLVEDAVSERVAEWARFEWSLRNWWMLYLSVFVMGIMIGSVAILLGLICLKCNGKIDVVRCSLCLSALSLDVHCPSIFNAFFCAQSVRGKWVAFSCVFVMGIVVGSALIAATIAFVFKLS